MSDLQRKLNHEQQIIQHFSFNTISFSYTAHDSITGENAPDTTTSNAVLICAKFESDAVQVQVNYSGDIWVW